MRVLLVIAFAWAQAEPATEPADADEAREELVPGMADLHLHQWVEHNYVGEFYYGSSDGTAPHTLDVCGWTGIDGPRQQPGVDRKHGQTGGRKNKPGVRLLSAIALDSNTNDDVRLHPPQGLSEDPRYPHWLGWPTSDTLAHHQAFAGWLRLAHDGQPFARYLEKVAPGQEEWELPAVQGHLVDFYSDYSQHMSDAFAEGRAGLNLAVVSLVASNNGCRALASKQTLKAHPEACDEGLILRTQYSAAVEWAERNRHWVAIVTHPEQARSVIAEGRLAIVLSLEAGDVLREYVEALREEHPGATPSSWTAADVRTAIHHVLDKHYPLVATLGPVHQVDNPFGGGAVVSLSMSHFQKLRLKGGDEVLRHPERLGRSVALAPSDLAACGLSGAKPQEPDVPYRLELANCYADAWWRQTRSVTSDPHRMLPVTVRNVFASSAGIDTYGAALYRRPGVEHDVNLREHWSKKAKCSEQPRIPHNQYGLSRHGELLVEVLQERGMPVDISHMSDQAVDDLTAFTASKVEERKPVFYLSHAYPRMANRTPGELPVSDATLRMVAAQQGVIGLRPGDDPVRTERLRECVDPQNGEQIDCPAAPSTGVPSLAGNLEDLLDHSSCQGTSVGTLAFAAYVRQVAGADTKLAFGTDLNGYINQPGPTGQPRHPHRDGCSPSCASEVPATGSEFDTRGLAHIGLLPSLLEAMRTADEAIEDDPSSREDELRTDALHRLSVSADAFVTTWEVAMDRAAAPRIAHPHDMGEQPSYPRRSSALDYEPLPTQRAIEGVLPYVVTAGHQAPVVHAPQVPTNLGLLLGWRTFTQQRDRGQIRSEWKRCKGAWRKRECHQLLASMQEATKAQSLSLGARDWHKHWQRSFRGSVDDWDHFASQLTENSSFHVAEAYREAFDHAYQFVRQDLSCLQEPQFVDAPIPSIEGGRDGRQLICHLRNDRSEACPYADDRDQGALSCYCRLLAAWPEGNLTRRDKQIRDLCP